MSKIDFSDSEREIMEFLWANNMQPVSLRHITHYFNDELNKNWKQQAIRVFLARLKEKGYLHIFVDTDTKKYVYLPTMTKKEYLHNMSKKILGSFFNNSIYDFISAFSGGEKLSEEDAEELKKFLNE